MLTKEDLLRIGKLLNPRFSDMKDDILQLNKKMDEGFERIYRYLSSRLENLQNTTELNAVDIDMIKDRMLRDKASRGYVKSRRSFRPYLRS